MSEHAENAGPSECLTPKPLRGSVVWMGLLTLLLLLAVFWAERKSLDWSAVSGLQWQSWVKHHPHPHRPVASELLTFFTVAWCFMLGGSFGSFLNCAAYRMPRGLSIVARPSACPACNANIRAWHNVPVFGWLALGGRCAQCKWEIPVRYALVELLFGGAFLVLLTFVGFNGGWNLPDRLGPLRYGVENLWESDGSIGPILGVYCGLMVFLLTYSLFAYDGFRVPLVIAVMGVALAFAARWFVNLPGMRLPMLRELGPAAFDPLRTAFDEFGDLTCGVLIGFLLSRRIGANVRSGDSPATILSTIMIALVIGWPALLGAAILTIPVRAVQAALGLARLPLAASLAITTLAVISFWAYWLRVPYWPSLTAGPAITVGAVIVIAAGSALVDAIESRYFSKQ